MRKGARQRAPLDKSKDEEEAVQDGDGLSDTCTEHVVSADPVDADAASVSGSGSEGTGVRVKSGVASVLRMSAVLPLRVMLLLVPKALLAPKASFELQPRPVSARKPKAL